MYLWPYRLTTASGAAPLTITDLGVIEEVVDTAQSSLPLHFVSRRNLLDAYSILTTTGSPQWFYVDNGVVRTYPVGGTLSVPVLQADTGFDGGSGPVDAGGLSLADRGFGGAARFEVEGRCGWGGGVAAVHQR
jgi:hypothetical protein